MIGDFAINVAAGVFLSVLVWFIFQVLQPRYLAWRYKAPVLEGIWSFRDSDAVDAAVVGTAQVKQAGETLSVVVSRTIGRKGQPLSRTFHCKGRVRDGQILLTYEEPESGGFICGNLTLKLSGNLKLLTGLAVHLDRESGKVVAHEIYFHRP